MAVVDVVRAIDHFRERVIHRDLKPENLLYKDSDPGSPLKVIDRAGDAARRSTSAAATSYMAPEVLGAYSTEVDLWSSA